MDKIKKLWIIRTNVLQAWSFFFLLSICVDSPYSIMQRFFISGAFASAICLTIISLKK